MSDGLASSPRCEGGYEIIIEQDGTGEDMRVAQHADRMSFVKPEGFLAPAGLEYEIEMKSVTAGGNKTSRLNRWQAGALAVTAVALLLALEVFDEQEIDFLGLGLEVVEISLIVTASLATLMLFSRVEDQERRNSR